jgi:hypothetical protein
VASPSERRRRLTMEQGDPGFCGDCERKA